VQEGQQRQLAQFRALRDANTLEEYFQRAQAIDEVTPVPPSDPVMAAVAMNEAAVDGEEGGQSASLEREEAAAEEAEDTSVALVRKEGESLGAFLTRIERRAKAGLLEHAADVAHKARICDELIARIDSALNQHTP
jgi:hypothetical protein